MIKEGKRPDKIEHLANAYMEKLKEEDVTLDEAKEVIKRMDCILKNSERYSPKTLLHDIPLRD